MERSGTSETQIGANIDCNRQWVFFLTFKQDILDFSANFVFVQPFSMKRKIDLTAV